MEDQKKFNGARVEWETLAFFEEGGLRVTVSRLALPAGSRFSMAIGAIRQDGSTGMFIQLMSDSDLLSAKLKQPYFAILVDMLEKAQNAIEHEMAYELVQRQEYAGSQAEKYGNAGPQTRHTGKTARERAKKHKVG